MKFFSVEFFSVAGAILALVGTYASPCRGDAPTANRPNIVLIMSDDHAYQAISAYGSELINTPHIDRIAAGGMRFDRCYVTNSICGPSRACILTGKYSHKNGYYANGQEFDNRQTTFPELLQQAGYQTALIGKWHLGRNTLPEGFDYWQILYDQGYYYQSKWVTPQGLTQHVGYTTDLITRYTLDWLENYRDKQRPFLLMMHHKAPHRPWDPAPKHVNAFEDHKFPEPDTLFDDYQGRSAAARQATMRIADDMNVEGPDLKAWDKLPTSGAREWFYGKMTRDQLRAWKTAYDHKNAAVYAGQLQGKQLTRWKYQRFLHDYLACVLSVDESVGQLLDYLRDNQLEKNTLVVYCSDQGMYLGEHGWFDKRFMYEPSLRTPLMVRWPGVTPPGAVNNQHIVSNLDFAQTLLDAAGVTPPADMQGHSITPLLRGQTPNGWRDDFYYHYYEGATGVHKVCEHYGVTTGRHKLVHYYKIDEWELFDLEIDPDELNSVYADPQYAPIRERLRRRLARLRRELEISSNDRPAETPVAPTP